jgi:hypothetical protein
VYHSGGRKLLNLLIFLVDHRLSKAMVPRRGLRKSVRCQALVAEVRATRPI